MLGELPTELVETICAKLPVKDRLRLSFTSKAYRLDADYINKQYARKRRQVLNNHRWKVYCINASLMRGKQYPHCYTNGDEALERDVETYLWLQR